MLLSGKVHAAEIAAALFVAASLCSSTARAERTLFTDNFHSPDATPEAGGVNAGIKEPGRQGGPLAPLAYKQKPDSQHQATIAKGLVVTGPTVNARCSPDHDFLTDFKDTGIAPALAISCTFSTPKGGNFSNGSFAFFSLATTAGIFGDNPEGFGVLISGNGTGQLFFAGSSENFSYTPSGEDKNKVLLDFTASADGATDTIGVAINGIKIHTYLLGKGGFGRALKSLYLTFGVEFNATGSFEGLSIAAPTLPAN